MKKIIDRYMAYENILDKEITLNIRASEFNELKKSMKNNKPSIYSPINDNSFMLGKITINSINL